jgi:hypothetical protein
LVTEKDFQTAIDVAKSSFIRGKDLIACFLVDTQFLCVGTHFVHLVKPCSGAFSMHQFRKILLCQIKQFGL